MTNPALLKHSRQNITENLQDSDVYIMRFIKMRCRNIEGDPFDDLTPDQQDEMLQELLENIEALMSIRHELAERGVTNTVRYRNPPRPVRVIDSLNANDTSPF